MLLLGIVFLSEFKASEVQIYAQHAIPRNEPPLTGIIFLFTDFYLFILLQKATFDP